jgi:hypothetical protein
LRLQIPPQLAPERAAQVSLKKLVSNSSTRFASEPAMENYEIGWRCGSIDDDKPDQERPESFTKLLDLGLEQTSNRAQRNH